VKRTPAEEEEFQACHHLLLCTRAKPNKRILQGSFSGRREVLDFLRVQTQNTGSFLKIEIDGKHVADEKKSVARNSSKTSIFI
jgi:hypothetical protein